MLTSESVTLYLTKFESTYIPPKLKIIYVISKYFTLFCKTVRSEKQLIYFKQCFYQNLEYCLVVICLLLKFLVRVMEEGTRDIQNIVHANFYFWIVSSFLECEIGI